MVFGVALLFAHKLLVLFTIVKGFFFLMTSTTNWIILYLIRIYFLDQVRDKDAKRVNYFRALETQRDFATVVAYHLAFSLITPLAHFSFPCGGHAHTRWLHWRLLRQKRINIVSLVRSLVVKGQRCVEGRGVIHICCQRNTNVTERWLFLVYFVLGHHLCNYKIAIQRFAFFLRQILFAERTFDTIFFTFK